MFESALWIASNDRIPCRGRMIAHAYREICSMLMNEYSSNSRQELRANLDALVVEYRNLRVGFDVEYGTSPTPDGSSTAVPDTFLEAVGEVVRIHSTADNARVRARRLIEGLARHRPTQPDIGPTSDRWFEMARFFAGHAHHDGKTADAEFMQGRFGDEVEFFEETLSAFAEPAAQNLDALDEVLENANS